MAFVYYVSCYVQLSFTFINFNSCVLSGIDETLCICFDPLMVFDVLYKYYDM